MVNKRKTTTTTKTPKKKKLNDETSKSTKTIKNEDIMEQVETLIFKDETKKAIELLDSSIKDGSITAMTKMGILLHEGKIIEKNDEKALKLFEEAITKENLLPMYFQDELDESFDTLKNYTTKEKKKKKKDVNERALGSAFLLMGKIAEINENSRQILNFFRTSAEYGNLEAMIKTGDLYRSGVYCKQDLKLSIGYYEKAMDAKSAIGLTKYCEMLIGGLGIQKNETAALDMLEKYLKLLDKKDDKNFTFLGAIYQLLGSMYLDAGFDLGDIYYLELGRTKDEKKARDYYEKAIEHTDIKSIPEDKKSDFSDVLNNLGIIYFYQSSFERNQDFKKARKYFQTALDLGFFGARQTLDYFDANDFGAPSDDSVSDSSDEE
eukprot:gene3227-5542_t